MMIRNKFRLSGLKLICLIALLVVVSATLILLGIKSSSEITSGIADQISFDIFYPNPNQKIVIDKPTLKYSQQLNQLSFVVRLSGHSITVSEQAAPGSFDPQVDPTFYDQFIQKLNPYANFGSTIGTVYLTEPNGLSNQTAVLYSTGTLMFARSKSDLPMSDWRLFFNDLSLKNP